MMSPQEQERMMKIENRLKILESNDKTSGEFVWEERIEKLERDVIQKVSILDFNFIKVKVDKLHYIVKHISLAVQGLLDILRNYDERVQTIKIDS